MGLGKRPKDSQKNSQYENKLAFKFIVFSQ